MSTTVEGGRPLLRLRVLGFGVQVDLSFLVMIGLLGYLSEGASPRIALWLVVAPVAVLVHELGHAAVARSTGARPTIALTGFGGLTSWVPSGPVSRVRSIAISLAGPGVGLALGALIYVVAGLWPPAPGGVLAAAYGIALFTTVGWSVLNLLPVLPLDGGQAMRDLLPGDQSVRTRRAAAVSLVVAVAAGALALRAGYVFGAVFAAFFVLTNLLTIRSSSGRPAPGHPAPGHPAPGHPAPGHPAPGRDTAPHVGGPQQAGDTPSRDVVGLLWQGRPDLARSALAAQPEGAVPDLAVHGAVLATTGDQAQGLALLDQEAARRPQDVDVAALQALTAALRQDWGGLVELVDGSRGPLVPTAVLVRVRDLAAEHGASQAVLVLDRARGARPS